MCTRPNSPLPNFGGPIGGSSTEDLFDITLVAGAGLPDLGARLCLGGRRVGGPAGAEPAGAELVEVAAGSFTPGLAIVGFLGESGSLSIEEAETGLLTVEAVDFAAAGRIAEDLTVGPEVAGADMAAGTLPFAVAPLADFG